MDYNLQELRRDFAANGDSESASKLAGALLRLNDLESYERAAEANDEEALVLIPYMRRLALGEIADELEERHGRFRFVDKDRQPKFKYVNVYCKNIPLASIQVDDYANYRAARNWITEFYANLGSLLLPPSQIRTTRMMNKNYFFVPLFHEDSCDSGQILLEDDPCFDFTAYRIKPTTIWIPGETAGMHREIAEDDYAEDDYGSPAGLAEIMYGDLPPFARPSDTLNVPQYVSTSEVTRGMRRYSDGSSGYDNFFNTVAIIYVGYIPDLLKTYWEWTPKRYRYVCENTPESEFVQQQLQEFMEDYPHMALEGAPANLLPCPQAGVEVILEAARERCQGCNTYLNRELLHPRQLVLREDYEPYQEEDILENPPEPPPHLNEALAFLQRHFDDTIHGDIYSVLGGVGLSIGVYQASYEPDDPK